MENLLRRELPFRLQQSFLMRAKKKGKITNGILEYFTKKGSNDKRSVSNANYPMKDFKSYVKFLVIVAVIRI